jgi:hypothetical protein
MQKRPKINLVSHESASKMINDNSRGGKFKIGCNTNIYRRFKFKIGPAAPFAITNFFNHFNFRLVVFYGKVFKKQTKQMEDKMNRLPHEFKKNNYCISSKMFQIH